jgi:hypothetical protein
LDQVVEHRFDAVSARDMVKRWTRPPTLSKSAWLVTWVGTTGVPKDPIVAILNYRNSGRSVRDFVEQLYVTLQADIEMKLAYAKKPKDTPYRASKTPFQRIFCGHNPWLYARLVSNLKAHGEKLTWTEPRSEDELRQELRDAGILR